MNKRKLRRVAIVALVLVLLCNTLGVQASTKKDDPTVIVKDYGSLYTAIAEAKRMRVKPLKIDFRGILYKGYIINAQ